VTDTDGAARRTIRGFRRAAVLAVLVSLGGAAALGISALFSGDFGDTQSRILLTTLLTGAAGVASLCHLAVIGRPVRSIGILGLAVTGIAYVLGLLLVWRNADNSADDLLRAFGAAWVLALSFAQADLLLLLGGRRPVRAGLDLTLVFVAVVAAGLLLPILTDGEVPGDSGDVYWRWFGAVAILDALGTIVMPIAGLFLRDPGSAPVSRGNVTVTLTGEAAERVRRLAADRGQPAERVIDELLMTAPMPDPQLPLSGSSNPAG
jgi:hypothetical protein